MPKITRSEPWQDRFVEANGLRFHVVTSEAAGGRPARGLVLLLHGFPEFWYSWRRQIPALASAGFEVAAPDLRGYNDSHKPEGAAAYAFAMLHPEMTDRLCVLNSPHPALFARELGRGNVEQLRKSWYMFFFQLPEAPERLLAADNFRLP